MSKDNRKCSYYMREGSPPPVRFDRKPLNWSSDANRISTSQAGHRKTPKNDENRKPDQCRPPATPPRPKPHERKLRRMKISLRKESKNSKYADWLPIMRSVLSQYYNLDPQFYEENEENESRDDYGMVDWMLQLRKDEGVIKRDEFMTREGLWSFRSDSNSFSDKLRLENSINKLWDDIFGGRRCLMPKEVPEESIIGFVKLLSRVKHGYELPRSLPSKIRQYTQEAASHQDTFYLHWKKNPSPEDLQQIFLDRKITDPSIIFLQTWIDEAGSYPKHYKAICGAITRLRSEYGAIKSFEDTDIFTVAYLITSLIRFGRSSPEKALIVIDAVLHLTSRRNLRQVFHVVTARSRKDDLILSLYLFYRLRASDDNSRSDLILDLLAAVGTELAKMESSTTDTESNCVHLRLCFHIVVYLVLNSHLWKGDLLMFRDLSGIVDLAIGSKANKRLWRYIGELDLYEHSIQQLSLRKRKKQSKHERGLHAMGTLLGLTVEKIRA